MAAGMLLVGHGSRRNPGANRPAYLHAQQIRRTGRFAEVRVAFWKADPFLAHGLAGMEADPVFVVPLFMSDGYYTRDVIPRELRLDGPSTRRDGRTLLYTPPVGVHPAIAHVIVQRALETGAGPSSRLIVLGHGTPRNPHSAQTIYAQAERVAARHAFVSVHTAFIDQEPRIEDLCRAMEHEDLVIVPLFMADGWHVSETIPRDLRLRDDVRPQAGGRSIRCGRAVGTHPAIVGVIEELCSEMESAHLAPGSPPRL